MDKLHNVAGSSRTFCCLGDQITICVAFMARGSDVCYQTDKDTCKSNPLQCTVVVLFFVFCFPENVPSVQLYCCFFNHTFTSLSHQQQLSGGHFLSRFMVQIFAPCAAACSRSRNSGLIKGFVALCSSCQ